MRSTPSNVSTELAAAHDAAASSLPSGAASELDDYKRDVAVRDWRGRLVAAFLEWGIFVALVVMFAYFALSTKYFLTTANLVNIGTAVAVTGILAAGLTVALIAGQLDLTVGISAVLATTIIGTVWISDGHSLAAALVLSIAAGLAVGAVNGILVVNFGINSIIATIAMSQAVLGLCLIIPKERGQNIYFTNRALSDFVNHTYAHVPVAVFLTLAVYVILYVVMTHTPFGWHVYATGGNASAALRAGVSTSAIYRIVFLITALLSVLAGVILIGRGGIGGPAIGGTGGGAGYTFDALTAVLLGGIGLAGGRGRIEATLAGVLLVGVLENGLTLRNVDGFYQILIRGLVLVLAVILGAYGEKRRAR
jgi:ribose/xylose/arabinose/galactoside ABC-type transport system permease subunit